MLMGQFFSKSDHVRDAPNPPQSAFRACARPDVAAALRRNWPVDRYGPWPSPDTVPIVYNESYNITFFGLEKLHPFDSTKYRNVLALLRRTGTVPDRRHIVRAPEAALSTLADVHSPSYLQSLERSSLKVAQVTELSPLAAIPAALLRRRVLCPMRTMAGGSVVAGALALERGWAMNLGGGMHHAHYHDGSGWCAYDDITLMLRSLREASGGLFSQAMIIDVDVHQGNGYQRSKLHFKDSQTFIVDVYNADVFPRDHHARSAIDVERRLRSGVETEAYLTAVREALEEAFQRCQPPPQLIVYNAGTDILDGDPLGLLHVSQSGVVERDELVMAAALRHGVPVVMLLSGGYTRASTPCIVHSLENIHRRFGVLI